MFLHLGGEAIVKKKDIVAIFDMDNTTISRASREFLANAQDKGMVINVSDELPKSYIVTKSENGTSVIISKKYNGISLRISRSAKMT